MSRFLTRLVFLLGVIGAFAPNFPTKNEIWQSDVNAQSHKLLNLDKSGSGIEASLGNPSVTGYVLSSTTAGVRSWVAQSGGGGTPGGSNTQLQYNNSGAFGGVTGATTNGTALTLTSPVFITPALGTPASG